MIVPAWINPAFKLFEDGHTWAWSDINALALRLQPQLPLGNRVAVTARSAATLIAVLVAAQRAGVEVVLLRGTTPRPAGASIQIEKGGRVVRLGPGVSLNAALGFSLLIPTSGTTGEPKLVRQDFTRLIGRLRGGHGRDSRWLLAYEPTAFGGLQVILAAITAGATLIAAPGTDTAGLARLALDQGVTHVSATPGVWRRLLAAFGDEAPALRVVTLGGDAPDQPLLDQLAARFPQARQRQIYASSEAGVVFTVADGLAGFPVAWLESGVDDVELRIRQRGLEIRSPRAMLGYAGGESRPFTADGWLITGDLIEPAGDRLLFAGRTEALLAIGNTKVSPARIERVLLEVPGVFDVLVAQVDGELTATVVATPGAAPDQVLDGIRRQADASLSPAERPQAVVFAADIPLFATGKKVRASGF